MMREIPRCMGCMNEKLYSGPCMICGYIDNDAYPAGCLAPRTFLADRYVLGKVLYKGGEGAVYLAFDTTENKAVEIKEFMPDTLCRRAADGLTVEVTDGALPLFKSYLSDYAELNKTLISSVENRSIVGTYEIFAANVTGYVCAEHIDGITLEEKLAQSGGKMSWNEAAGMFAPLLDAAEYLHSKNIIHRGISPETVCFTKDGRLVLRAFEISAARSSGTQINFDKYPGYTACEQYDLSEKQGSWTDVYAVCAVLYRALTGTVPPDAGSRRTDDRLAAPADINDDIPRYISDIIVEGMTVDPTARIRNISILKQKLYAPEPVPAVTAAVPPVREEPDGPISPRVQVKFDDEERLSDVKKPSRSADKRMTKKKRMQKEKTRANIGTAAGLIIFLALVTALVIAIIYFSEQAQNIAGGTVTASSTSGAVTTAEEEDEITVPVTETTTTTTAAAETAQAQDKLMMPDFVNRFFNSSLTSRYSMLQFEEETEYNDEYAQGIIMEQDIPAGTQVTSGTVVHIKVSGGPAYTTLPDYVGVKLSDYTSKLTNLGIRFETVAEETSEVKMGYVVRCSKDVGDRVYISQNEGITVYYAVTPTVTTTTTGATSPPPETTTVTTTETTTKKTRTTTAPPDEDDDEYVG